MQQKFVKQIRFVKKKQSNGKFKIQRLTSQPDGSWKKATIQKDLPPQVAKDTLFMINRNRQK